MRKKVSISKIYIATTKKDPEDLKIGGKTIAQILQAHNSKDPDFQFRSILKPEFQLGKIKRMDWVTENEFRLQSISICIIDGRQFNKHLNEIHTIRAYFFPESKDLPQFCVTSPQNAQKALTGDRCTVDEAHSYLQKELFRFPVAKPDYNSFVNMLTSIRFAWDLERSHSSGTSKLWINETFG